VRIIFLHYFLFIDVFGFNVKNINYIWNDLYTRYHSRCKN